MKRLRSKYHAFHVLKTAEPRFLKALITNCNKEHVNYIIECVLNVLNGNIKFSACDTSKLKKKAAIRKGVNRYVTHSGRKRLLVQRGGFLLFLLGAIVTKIDSLISHR